MGESPEPIGTLIVSRHRYIGFLQRWSVFIDEQHAGRLWAGDTLQVKLSPGRHSVQIRIGWLARSRVTGFELRPKETKRVRGRARGDAVTALYWALFRPWQSILIVDSDGTSELPDTAPVAEWLRRRRASSRGR